MAATTPSDTNPSGDDSHVFRRSKPKPAKAPEEPAELLEFGSGLTLDDEDALGDLGNQPASGDPPSAIMRRGYREGSSVNLGGATTKLGESGSSIFAHAESIAPSAPGSGWFDSIPPESKSIHAAEGTSPSDNDLGKTHIVEDLFTNLDADSAAVPVAGWQDQQATNSVTESEVIRAFDNIGDSARHVTLAQSEDAMDYDATQPSGSHIFPDNTSLDLDPSGVDLLNPHSDAERLTGPRSSIFGAPSNKELTELDLEPPASMNEDATEDMTFTEGEGGSSIFNKTSPFLSLDKERDVVQFPELPTEQASGMVDWETKPLTDEMQPSLMMPFTGDDDDDAVNPFSDEATLEAPMKPTPVQKRSGPVGTSGAGMVVAPAKPRDADDDDDEPVAKPKSKREPVRVKQDKEPAERRGGSGILGWVGGGVMGLILGAGAFAGLYLGNVLPSAEGTKPTTAIVQNPGPSPEIAALEAKQEELKKELLAAKNATAKAEGDKANLETSLATARADASVAAADLKTAKDEAAAATIAAKLNVDNTKKALDAAINNLKVAQANAVKFSEEANKATADLKAELAISEAARAEAKEAKTLAVKAAADLKAEKEATDAAKAEAKLAKTNADKYALDLDAAKKAVDDKTKLTVDAEAKAVEAQKKLAASETGLASFVKELKANKLIDDKIDTPAALAQLPEVLKKLNSVAMSPDIKKAAEALLAAKKELEASQAALKLAEVAKTKAETEVLLAKADADVKVAAAKKQADTDVLAAKKETDAAKKETDAKVVAAVEKATADSKKALADAEADKKALVDKQKIELTMMQATFTQQLAEARKGGVQITPAEVQTLDRAARDFHAGVQAYQKKEFDKALEKLDAAVKLDPTDARYWYYLGLTQWELGQKGDAQAAFKKGGDLEARSKPNAALVGDALERIQGDLRKELNKFR